MKESTFVPMPETIDIHCLPLELQKDEVLLTKIATSLAISEDEIASFRISKRSIDARKQPVVYRLRIEVFLKGDLISEEVYNPEYQNVENAKELAIVGFGPAGIFAALECLKLGLKPVVFERGKDVRERRRDLAKINKEHIVNSDSNYCFGEGGAGTYSDGKLYTRSHKRGKIIDVLMQLVHHGAKNDILIDAHPHIGTNHLPQLISAMRETILSHGGEIKFNERVEALKIENKVFKGLKTNKGDYSFDHVVIATGHSARDMYEICFRDGVKIERKPFALGVRVEHPQNLIDQAQYRQFRGDFLPPASYSLVTQANGVGVYSFCMCPGGIIAPCATAPEEVVTNGWSPSKRNNPHANSGVVVEMSDELLDKQGYTGVFGALNLQKEVERACWIAGGENQTVPAQRLNDFMKDRLSRDLPACSYVPGVKSVNLNDVLPKFISERLKAAFKDFARKMPVYLHNDAILVAPESRTSSPIRIPRDRQTFEHVEVKGLYPCAEGAGYAGGIVSAAMDGQKVVQAIEKSIR